MPELPEVETLRRSLELQLPGRQIVGLQVRETRFRKRVNRAALQRTVMGQRITAVSRRAKYLLIELSDCRNLLLHLGMSGRLLMVAHDKPLDTHEHVIFTLDDGRDLRFCDPRRFGLVLSVATDKLSDCAELKSLGCEPLADAFDDACLFALTRKRKKPIKNLLMDATLIVGVGNIYASEALHDARVRPTRLAKTLSRVECTYIVSSIKNVLARAIARGGTTINDFQNTAGESGYFQQDLQVYDRKDEPCRQCATPIRRKVMAGRSTFYCPTCQR